MLSCRVACRRAVQQSRDDVPLCRSFKRYGSSVPGPLEAQRRLARRRMMNLTTAYGEAGLDVGVFMGPEGWLERQDWKWQAPSAVRHKPKDTATPELPPWLANTASRPVATLSTIDKKIPDEGEAAIHSKPRPSEITQRESKMRLPNGPSQLVRDLLLATDLSQVRRAITDIKRSPSDPPGLDYGMLAMERLLDFHAPTDVLIDFIASPATNFSGAQIIRKIFQHFGQRPITSRMYTSIASMLKQAMVLGLASDEEIREIIYHVPNLVSRDHANQSDIATLSLYLSIWEGIQSCSVLPAGDLSGETLNLLLCQLKPIPFSTDMQRLGVSIISSASPQQLRDMKRGVSSFLVNWMRGYGDSVANSGAGQVGAIPEMIELLNGLPDELAGSFVSSTTSALLLEKVIVIEPESPFDRLYQWVDTVAHCRSVSKSGTEWRAIEDMLAADRSQQRVARYLAGLGSREVCEFFLRYWVCYEIEESGCGHRASVIFHKVQRRFRSLCTGPDDPKSYFNILLALRHLGLPYGVVAMELFRLLSHISRYTSMVNVAKNMRRHGLPLGHGKISHTIHDVGKVSPSSAVRLLSLFPMVKPEDHNDLLCQAIEKKLLYAEEIFALIENNARLRKSRKPNADLLHNLAIAFAHSPHLTPRAALRYVHWCWLRLRRYMLLPTPVISRALAHAGITRSLQAGRWVSSVKLAWILELVRKLESPEVANELDATVFRWQGRIIEDRRRKVEEVSPHDGRGGLSQMGDTLDGEPLEDDEWETITDKTAACNIND